MHSSVRDAIRVMHIACTTQTHTDRRRNIPASAKWMPINENEEVVVVAKRKGRSASVHRMHAGRLRMLQCHKLLHYRVSHAT